MVVRADGVFPCRTKQGPPTSLVHTRTRQVRIVANAASLDIATDAIEASVEPGGSVGIARTLGNGGTGRLDWSAGAAHARSHFPSHARAVIPLHEADMTAFAPSDGAASAPSSGAAPRSS